MPSLVGSEMCIRDRILIILIGLQRPVRMIIAAKEALCLHQLNIAVDVLRITCLLYTSDAADDLLCVDLGGRRIIKKKNQTKKKQKNKTINPNNTEAHTGQLTSYIIPQKRN